MAVRNAGSHTAVMRIDDCVVVAYFIAFLKQIGEVRALFLIDGVCMKFLISFIFKDFMGLPRSYPGFFGRTIDFSPNSAFIYL